MTAEHEGYLTAVTAADDSRRELYLHAGECSFRLLLGDTALPSGVPDADGLPLGPGHRVRIAGSLTGAADLPTLRADRVELLASPAAGGAARDS